MNKLPFQFLFLFLCILGGAYINRRNFSGVQQKVMGFYLPKPVIITTLSIFMGLFFWLIINIILWQFQK